MLWDTVDAVASPDEGAMAEARDRLGRMTKPPGSLGGLEDLVVRLAGLAA